MSSLLKPNPETESFKFDFEAFTKDMECIDIEQVAQDALGDILKVADEQGNERSIEQIYQETEQFFANPVIQENFQLLNAAAVQFAQFCNHNHAMGQELASGSLSGLYELGNHSSDGHDHGDHADHEHEQKNTSDDERDIGPDGKKRKKRKFSWLSFFN